MEPSTAVPIASGATGRVVRQFDPARGCDIALKLLHRDDPLWAQRMLREAEVQMRLSHPHICEVYGTGRLGDQPYIAMRLVEGDTLDVAARAFSDRDKAALLAQVADAIAYAHAQGAVHRDLKPSNILVERRDGVAHAVVVDFGLARELGCSELTRTGQLLGTPGYMAPEQATDAARVDGRADIYSLGVIAFELFAGRRPFLGESATEVLIQALRHEPPSLASLRPDLDPALARIVRQCIETDPDWRYPDAGALREDLLAFRDGRRVQARRDGSLRRTRRFLRRHPWRAGLGAASAALLLGLLGSLLHSTWYARQQSLAAQRYVEFASGVEAAIRFEHMKPAHDVSAVRERLQARVRAFAAALPSGGPAAERTGRFALARAQLALGDIDAARVELERAVAAGEDGIELARALGEVLLRQYFEALRATATLETDELREAALDELERSHRAPARRWLQRAALGGEPEADASRALLRWLDGDAPAAAAELGDAAQRLAWPVDALLQAGDLLGEEALRLGLAGETEAALALWRRASAHYRDAVDVARSHPLARAALCRAGGEFATQLRHGAAVTPDEIDALLGECDRAIALDPGHAATHAAKARALADFGLLQRHRGRWTDTDFAPALLAARRALELDPDSLAARRALGALLTQRAYWLVERGASEGAEAAREAVALLDAAQAADPASPFGALLLSNAHRAVARAAGLHGGDADAALLASERALARVVDAGEAPVVIEAHLIDSLTWRGFEAGMAGRDAAAVLEEAVDRALRLRERAAQHPRVDPVLGMAAWSLGDYRLLAGEDAEPVLQLALEAYRRVMARAAPGFADSFNAVSVLQVLAELRALQGEDIHAELDELARWTAQLRALAGDEQPIDIQLAANAHLAARQAAREGSDPRPHLRSARQHLELALAHPIDAREATVMLARLAASELEWQLTEADVLQRDLAQLEAAIQRHPDHARLKCETARLLRLRGQPQDLVRAQALFAEAVARLPVLRAGYADLAAADAPG